MTQTLTRTLGLLAFSLCHVVTASSVAVYKDSECKTIVSTLTASNGYPDGTCTTASEENTKDLQSFKFLSLDTGCAATVYQAGGDEGTCSGYAIVASLSTCYNSSWVDFSVDECTEPVNSSNTTGNATVSTRPSAASPTPASTIPSSSTGSTPSSTVSAKSGASLDGVTRTGSLGMCTGLVIGIYLLLL